MDALIEYAERQGLVLFPWPDGTLSVFGDQDADEGLMRAIVARSAEVVDAIHRNTAPSKELAPSR